MRVVTTSNAAGLEAYAHRWLDSRDKWPKGTDFRYYTEGFTVDCPGKDFADMPKFSHWKAKHSNYLAPSWRFDVVRYAHKVFAAIDALYDYDGIGVWLDADCVTFKKLPAGLIERQVKDCYLACYQRTGMYTETGMWIMDCGHAQHREFLDTWKSLYLTERYKQLHMWTDCNTLDATIRITGVPVLNLSGAAHKHMHPMAVTELGKYIDHCKGPRKIEGKSPENKFRKAA